MKKRFPALSGSLLVLLAAALAGCSDSVPEPETTAAPRPAITEQETEVILGAEVLTGAEIDRLKTSREQIPPDDERVVLYYNGVELACSGGRSVFYATIPEADSNDSWPGGTLSSPVGYRVIIEKDYTYKDPSELIASGTPLSVFLIGEVERKRYIYSGRHYKYYGKLLGSDPLFRSDYPGM